MSWFNPSSKVVANHIDRIFRTETGEAYYTRKALDPHQQIKQDEVNDRMYSYLQGKWLQHDNRRSPEDRLRKVRANANCVIKHIRNPAASSAIDEATRTALDQLNHRTVNKIPLHACVVPGTGREYPASAARSVAPSDAGNAMTRNPSLSGSVCSAPEQAEAAAMPPQNQQGTGMTLPLHHTGIKIGPMR